MSVAEGGGALVVVERVEFVVEGREPIVVPLGDAGGAGGGVAQIAEGVEFRFRITFSVRGEVAEGLMVHTVSTRKGLRVGQQAYMVGTYGTQASPHSYVTPADEMPEGMVARGEYVSKGALVSKAGDVYGEWLWPYALVRA